MKDAVLRKITWSVYDKDVDALTHALSETTPEELNNLELGIKRELLEGAYDAYITRDNKNIGALLRNEWVNKNISQLI